MIKAYVCMDVISIMSEAKGPGDYKELTRKLLAVLHSDPPDLVLFNKLWEENGRPRLNFSGEIFANHKLDRINLPGFNLEGSDFSRASLKDANLQGVKLKRAKLDSADLSRANLKEADLYEAYAPFSHIKGADLDHAILAGAELQVANLDRANLEYANFSDANLSKATLRNSSLKRAVLDSTNLEGAILTGASELPINEDAVMERGAILKELPSEPIVPGGPKSKPSTTILFLSSNPRDTDPLRVEEERKGIYAALATAKYGTQFRLENWDGISIEDFDKVLQDFNPDILHFAGHFTDEGEPLFLSKDGAADKVSVTSVTSVLEKNITHKGKLRCVVLNGANSKHLAQQIRRDIDYVIGASERLTYNDSLVFSRTFYMELANGISLGESFRRAINKLEFINAYQLMSRDNLDIDKAILIEEDKKKKLFGETSTHVITDRWTTEDTLGYGIYAHAIARFITHRKTAPPLCVSIQAPWGQGKTSLMRMIQQELDPDAVKELLVESPDTQLRRKFEQNKINLKQLVNINNQDQGKDSQSFFRKVKHWYVSKTKRFLNVEEIVKTELENPPEFKSLKVEGNKEQEVKPCFTIWYNAWAYESTEQVWSGLADSIVQQVAERLDPDESMRFLLGLNIRRYGKAKVEQKINDLVSAKWWQNILPSIKKYLPIIGISLVITTLGWIDKNQYWPIAGLTGLIGSLIASGLQILQELSRAKLSVQNDSAQQTLGEFVDVPDYTKGSVYMSHVIEDIQTIIKRIPHKNTNNKDTNNKDTGNYLPIIIFIDDLDRCSPNKVTDIIEAINLFLGGGYFSNCIFVIGMDAEMVAAALEESYSEVIAKLPQYPSHLATGWRFMDKFVQLPFVIPTPEMSVITEYVKKLFLQEQVQDKKLKEMQVKEAAKEVANEIVEHSNEGTKVEPKQNIKIEQNDKITTIAKKHGLTTEEDQQRLKYEVQDQKDKQDLNKKIDSFSFEDPEIRKIISNITPEFSGNPREVKRFMNVFRFNYFLLSARETKGLGILSLEQLSRWIVITLKWPTMSRWLQGSVQRLEKLEVFGRICKDNNAWRKKIETDLMLNRETFPEIFDEEVFIFFRREGKEIKKGEKLSSAAGKGMY